MVLKGTQIVDLSMDGSGRSGQLSPIVGIQGGRWNLIYSFYLFVIIT